MTLEERLAALELQLAAAAEANAELEKSLAWEREKNNQAGRTNTRTRTPLEMFLKGQITTLANGKPNTNDVLSRSVLSIDKILDRALSAPDQTYTQSGYEDFKLADWLVAFRATLDDWQARVADAPKA